MENSTNGSRVDAQRTFSLTERLSNLPNPLAITRELLRNKFILALSCTALVSAYFANPGKEHSQNSNEPIFEKPYNYILENFDFASVELENDYKDYNVIAFLYESEEDFLNGANPLEVQSKDITEITKFGLSKYEFEFKHFAEGKYVHIVFIPKDKDILNDNKLSKNVVEK